MTIELYELELSELEVITMNDLIVSNLNKFDTDHVQTLISIMQNKLPYKMDCIVKLDIDELNCIAHLISLEFESIINFDTNFKKSVKSIYDKINNLG